MTAIRIIGFTGEQPRVIPRLIPDSGAQAAFDVRLDDGGLMPTRRSVKVGDATLGWVSIFKWLGNWIGWTVPTESVPGPVAANRLYTTDGVKPKIRVEPPEVGSTTIYDLAVPRAMSTLSGNGLHAVVSGTIVSQDIQSRLYTFTWVTGFGEESEPAPASDNGVPIDWKPTQTVTLSGFPTTPAGRNITTQRIYRSQSGPSGTLYYLIAERGATSADYVDTIGVEKIMEPCPSLSYNAPQDKLEGLIALPNGMMAAYIGKKLYFSVPYQPHAWPEKYVLTVEHTIMGLGAMGTSIIVTTEAHPYMVSGSSPESMISQKIEQNLACINKRSVVDLGYAIAYASTNGLVVAQANGAIGIATANIFNRDGWLAFSPATMIGSQIAGRYVAFYKAQNADGVTFNTGGLLIDLGGGQSSLVRLSASALAAYFALEDSALYVLPEGSTAISQIDSPGAARNVLYWKSKEFVLPAPHNFSCLLIDAVAQRNAKEQAAYEAQAAAIAAANATLIAAGPLNAELNGAPMNIWEVNGDSLDPIPDATMITTVGIYADKVAVATVSETNRAIRLPSGFKARTWELDVSSNMRIDRIIMASTMDELKQTE